MHSPRPSPRPSPRQSLGPILTRSDGTYGDRRPDILQQSQAGDFRGRSVSRGSSSLITAHQLTISATASDSHTTGTNDSSTFNDVHVNPDDTHFLCVLDSNSNHPQLPLSLNLNPGTAQRHSIVLFNLLSQDRIRRSYNSTITPQEPVTVGALRLFLEHIDRPPPPPKSRAYEEMEMDFTKFFKLSIVLWTYICSIDQWTRIATDIKTKHWPHDRDFKTPNSSLQWLFVALVFNWPDVFAETSLWLLSEISRFQEEIDRAAFIPNEILEAIEHHRQKYARDTYTFIHNKYAMLFMLLDPSRSQRIPLASNIYAILKEKWDIDIRGDLPQDLYKTKSPSKLLRQVESTTSESHSEPTIMVLPARRTDSPPRNRRPEDDARSMQHELRRRGPGNRKSEAADALPVVFKFMIDKVKRKRPAAAVGGGHQQQGEPQIPRHELDKVCDRLLTECREFREETFRPLNLEEFAGLRQRCLLLGGT